LKDKIPTKKISPITAIKKSEIITINGYRIYFGTFLFLLTSILPSKTNSKINSNKYSIKTPSKK